MLIIKIKSILRQLLVQKTRIKATSARSVHIAGFLSHFEADYERRI